MVRWILIGVGMGGVGAEYGLIVPIVIDPSEFTVRAIVVVSGGVELSETVMVAVPSLTDVIVTKPVAVVRSAVATAGVSEETDVPTRPKTGTVFAVVLSVAGVNAKTLKGTAVNIKTKARTKIPKLNNLFFIF
jgi:hypothetical protein